MNEYKGIWWLPSNPELKVAGILYYTPGEEIRLETIGSFDSEHDNSIAVIFSSRREEIIQGQASDGTNITLFDSGCHIHHAGKASFSTVEYKARKIAIGMHLNGVDDKRFFKAIVKIPELSYWLYPATVQQVLADTATGHGIYVKMEDQTKEEREVAKTELQDGLSICLCRNATFQSGELSFKPTFEQYTSLQIESEADASPYDLYTIAVRYERFLSLSTLREVGFSELVMFSKDFTYKISKDKIGYKPVTFDTIFHQQPSVKKIEKLSFLFDYKQIAGQYPAVIKQWYAKDELFDAIRGHLLESIDYHGHFSYINFLVVIQAVEGYGRRYLIDEIDAYKKTLPKKSRIHELNKILTTIVRKFSDVSAINQNLNIEAIVDTRDYHSHLLPVQKKKRADGIDLYDLTDELRKILICCTLSYLGLTNAEINRLTSDTYNDLFRN